MRTIGIVQPNYIPWRGFFDLIRDVDVFVVLDDVQYTPRDWRSRNRIKLADGGTRWLSVPVLGGQNQSILEVRLDNTQDWSRKHFEALRHSYGKTPFFERYRDALEAFYEPARFERLVELDVALTKQICVWLDLAPEFVLASSLGVDGEREDRLLAIVSALDGKAYLSGPAARAYIRPERWRQAGVALRYKAYPGYPVYEQISEPFEPAVTVLDLLFMKGDEAPEYIWGAPLTGR